MAEDLRNNGIDCTVILDSAVGAIMEKIGILFFHQKDL
jgi:translation initiation factor 2B subunit (eIF-2B alpha/beta/delta family)